MALKYQYQEETTYDFIWNITLVCPWDCEFCCTDASHVKKENNKIVIYEKGLTDKLWVSEPNAEGPMHQRILSEGLTPTIFDAALSDRQRRGKEISYEEKISILNNMKGTKVEIDFAGGDPLSCFENYLVIKAASKLFGKESVSITSTGHSIKRYGVDSISKIIGEFEFTLDEITNEPALNRPSGYNNLNFFYAKQFAEKGVKTKAQLPIHNGNASLDGIEKIYQSLTKAGVDELLLMRTFPVGRGRVFLLKKGMYVRDEYNKIIDAYRKMEKKYDGPKVRLQCALKHLESLPGDKNPCDLMRESYGINPNGQLLLSAWATNDVGEPLSDDFVLGDLHKHSFKKLLQTAKAKSYFSKLDDNFGHCKIFSHIFSDEKNSHGIFTQSDPLYIE